MTRQAQLLGSYVMTSVSFQIQRTDGAYPLRTITMTNGTYYFASLGVADPLVELEAQVKLHAEFSNFDASYPAAFPKIVQLSMGIGETATITWTTAGEELRDRMRFSGATTSLAPSASGSRAPYFNVFPDLTMLTDDELRTFRASQARSSSGRVDTVKYTTWTDWRLGVQLDGPLRDTSYNEYHDLRDFFEEASTGAPFRYYPDRTVLTAYAEVSNPLGYQTFVLDTADATWDQPPAFGGWYKYFRKTFRCRAYV